MNSNQGGSWSDHAVPSDGISIAVRDYGGTGADVLLLHGGGRTMQDWRLVTPLLGGAGVRVVACDLRGHGASGAGRWSWRAAVDDVAAVVAAMDLRHPALVGHSLGGLVAALWASREPECPLAVNLDGHPNPTSPDQYGGLAPDAALAAHQAMRGFLDESLRAADDPALADLAAALDALDLFAVYRGTRCPLLVVSAARLGFEELLDPPVADAVAAYRIGFERDLAAVAAITPLLTTVEVDTGHDVPLEAPHEVASLVVERLGAAAKRGDPQ